IQLLLEIAPSVRRIGYIYDKRHPDNAKTLLEVQRVAEARGLTVIPASVSTQEEMPSAFETIVAARADALMSVPSFLTAELREETVGFARQHRLPPAFATRTQVEVGGLFSYTTDLMRQYAEPASYVDKILRGARPADIPVAQPSRLELLINLRTA